MTEVASLGVFSTRFFSAQVQHIANQVVFGWLPQSTYEQLFWEIVRFLMRQLSGNGAAVTHMRFFPDI